MYICKFSSEFYKPQLVSLKIHKHMQSENNPNHGEQQSLAKLERVEEQVSI